MPPALWQKTRIVGASLPSSVCLPVPCWRWCWQQICSPCLSPGNWSASAPTCSSASGSSGRECPLQPPRRSSSHVLRTWLFLRVCCCSLERSAPVALIPSSPLPLVPLSPPHCCLFLHSCCS